MGDGEVYVLSLRKMLKAEWERRRVGRLLIFKFVISSLSRDAAVCASIRLSIPCAFFYMIFLVRLILGSRLTRVKH